MCWSGEASAVLATIGISTTAYAAIKGEPRPLWISLGYFSLMEALQAFTYTVIDMCHLPANQVATLLGYLHIAFQPFFINAMSLYFIRQDIARKIAPAVYICCFITSIVMIIDLYPLQSVGQCTIGRPLCGTQLCSVHGEWHIAWELPLNAWHEAMTIDLPPFIRSLYLPYMLTAFALPILYGSWRLTIYQMTAGPILAKFLTHNPNEWPAIWCLLSIGILILVVKTPMRKHLYVRKWFLWPKEKVVL